MNQENQSHNPSSPPIEFRSLIARAQPIRHIFKHTHLDLCLGVHSEFTVYIDMRRKFSSSSLRAIVFLCSDVKVSLLVCIPYTEELRYNVISGTVIFSTV